ncbi:MAG: hypothetical protein KGL39_27955 [Patescibacteria group bacterium]|nr:hypothetical protein [Patescibacteria group bacterium]
MKTPGYLAPIASLLMAITFMAPGQGIPLRPAAATYDASRFGPYDPYRSAADRYWSLLPMYQHIADPAPPELAGWQWFISDGINRFTVQEILPDGIQVRASSLSFQGPAAYSYNSTFVLVHYPQKELLVDGQQISFLALRIANRQYQDAAGVTHTIPCYDYGTPYDPFALARAQKSLTNHVALTNSPLSKSP